MKINKIDILIHEIPDEVSLGIYVCGCNIRCAGCHSPQLWDEQTGYEFNIENLKETVNLYKKNISCVLFLGGEWHKDEINLYLDYINSLGLKTALYTGKEFICGSIKNRLNYLKTGPYIKELGGIESKTTNQVLVNVLTKEILNYKFHKDEKNIC